MDFLFFLNLWPFLTMGKEVYEIGVKEKESGATLVKSGHWLLDPDRGFGETHWRQIVSKSRQFHR